MLKLSPLAVNNSHSVVNGAEVFTELNDKHYILTVYNYNGFTTKQHASGRYSFVLF